MKWQWEPDGRIMVGKTYYSLPNKEVEMKDSQLVYSTETGRMCPKCGRPHSKCICRKSKSNAGERGPGDGIIRLKKEVKGRKGKAVTTIHGFQEPDQRLKKIASELKNRCGTGGSVKGGLIIIQGDHRDAVKAALTEKGYTVKLAGG